MESSNSHFKVENYLINFWILENCENPEKKNLLEDWSVNDFWGNMNDNSNEGDEKCINLKGFTNRTVGILNKQKNWSENAYKIIVKLPRKDLTA